MVLFTHTKLISEDNFIYNDIGIAISELYDNTNIVPKKVSVFVPYKVTYSWNKNKTVGIPIPEAILTEGFAFKDLCAFKYKCGTWAIAPFYPAFSRCILPLVSVGNKSDIQKIIPFIGDLEPIPYVKTQGSNKIYPKGDFDTKCYIMKQNRPCGRPECTREECQ